jgi:selenocysteine lyase/cysteine desulfurase
MFDLDTIRKDFPVLQQKVHGKAFGLFRQWGYHPKAKTGGPGYKRLLRKKEQ